MPRRIVPLATALSCLLRAVVLGLWALGEQPPGVRFAWGDGRDRTGWTLAFLEERVNLIRVTQSRPPAVRPVTHLPIDRTDWARSLLGVSVTARTPAVQDLFTKRILATYGRT